MSGGWRMGKVVQVDRVRRVVRGQLEHDYSSGEQPPVFEAYYHGEPPWPLANVRLAQVGSGIWECFGPIGDRQLLTHEGWGFYADNGDAWQQFDTGWTRQRAAATGLVGVFANGNLGSGSGGAIATAATIGQYINLRRSDAIAVLNVVGPRVTHFRATVRVPIATNRIVQVALANASASNFAAFGAGDLFIGFLSDTTVSSGNWIFTIADEAVTLAAIDTGVAPSTSAVDTFDAVVSPEGSFAVVWITRQTSVFDPNQVVAAVGPLVFDGPIPSGDLVSETIGIYPRTNSAQTLYVGRVTTELVHPIVHPTRDLILGQSGFPL